MSPSLSLSSKSTSLSSSFDSRMSSSVSESTNATAKRAPQQRKNHKVRQLMRLVHETLHNDNDNIDNDMNTDSSSKDWKKMKTYFYHNSATLTMIQVQKVLSCLLNVFSPDLVRHILQSTPRILKRNIKTQLQPTINFLQSLYGPSLLQNALQRKPDLLLLRGIGFYQSDVASAAGLDLIQVLLRHELKFTPSDIEKLQQTAPYLFQIPMVNVLSSIAYFTEILRAGFKSTSIAGNDSSNNSDNDDGVYDDDKINQKIRKLILSHPSILHLSLESNLKPRMEFLKEHCQFDASDLAFLLSSSSAGILSLSITENLAPTIHFLNGILGRQQRKGRDDTATAATAEANDDNSLRKCLRAHPQLLGLSLNNLQSKVSYFNAIDNINNINNKNKPRLGAAKSLASRILLRSPAVYSLSLNENIIPTVNFLAKIWGVNAPNAQVVNGDCVVMSNEHSSTTTSSSSSENNFLSCFLSEYPSILTLSLEGNLRPTVNFFNRTGYISLDADWNLVPASSSSRSSSSLSPPLRGRYIASSLFNRLLPRWHYCVTREKKELDSSSLQKREPKNTDRVDKIAAEVPVTSSSQSGARKSIVVKRRRRQRQHGGDPIIPLHILVSASDTAFCEAMDIDEVEYQEFKKEHIPRLKFSSQYDTWLKTGRPIEV